MVESIVQCLLLGWGSTMGPKKPGSCFLVLCGVAFSEQSHTLRAEAAAGRKAILAAMVRPVPEAHAERAA